MYKYLIIDGQYLLTRNFKLMISRYDDVQPKDVAVRVFQSVAKLRRDLVDYEIPLLLFDSAPYYKSTLIDDYKGSRHYYTEDDLEGVTDENEIARINEEIRINNIKRDAKNIILESFPLLGIKCIKYDGWEADDLGYLLGTLVREKSSLCSSDGDWNYLTNELVDNFRFNGEVITYEYMLSTVDKEVFEKAGNLQMYKAVIDSLYGSHNDLLQSIKPECKSFSFTELGKDSFGEFKYIDKKLFNTQLSTFRFSEFPSYNDVIAYLTNELNNTSYTKLEPDKFYEIVHKYKFRIGLGYYNEFIDSLNFK